MVKIHEKLGELLDKPVCALNECFRYKIQGLHLDHTTPRKVYNENKRNMHIKISLTEGRSSYGWITKAVGLISINFRSTILHTMKLLFV